MSSKPTSHKRIMVQKRTSNFREAVIIETVDICRPQKGEVCIKNKYVGINATDVNVTKGRYFTSDAFPHGVGFEGIGEIVAVGDQVQSLKTGQTAMYFNSKLNSYSEYVCVSAKEVFSVPEVKPEYIAMIVCGLTATIGLDKSARIEAGESVLITAAAGGTGHIAVQWAKAADCHVIGTCSTKEKENLLKELGCDRIVNYKEENLDEVLSKEYKNGVNVIWETIGGEVFSTCLKHLSRKGRLLIVGGIAGYKTEEEGGLPIVDLSSLPGELLMKSAALQGFFVLDYVDCFSTYIEYMIESYQQKSQLRLVIDDGKKTKDGEFFGMEGIIRGVEHLHSGKNVGKVVVRIY